MSAFKNNVSHFGKMRYGHVVTHKVAKNVAKDMSLHIPIIYGTIFQEQKTVCESGLQALNKKPSL